MTDSPNPFLLPAAFVTLPVLVPIHLELQVAGSAVLEAVESSRKAKQRASVKTHYRTDDRGYLIGIGFSHRLPGDDPSGLDESPIKWAHPSELQLRLLPKTGHPVSDASLRVRTTGPAGARRVRFTLTIGTFEALTLCFRLEYRLTRSSAVDFVVQVEMLQRKKSGNRRPLVRYDQAHGYVHRDLMLTKNHKDKHNLGAVNLLDGINKCFQDLRENLPVWLEQLSYRDLGEKLMANVDFVTELAMAERKLKNAVAKRGDPSEATSDFVMHSYREEPPVTIRLPGPPPGHPDYEAWKQLSVVAGSMASDGE